MVCSFFCNFAAAMEQEIKRTVEVLLNGGTILYPTDTIWGIGCDARNAAAVEKIYALKERDHTKSMLVLVESGRWREGNGGRPTTYILPREIWHDELQVEVADNLVAADGTLGVRVPQHTFCQEVMRRLGAPLVSTSANLSGHPSPQSYDDIEEGLKCRVDYCVAPLPELLSCEKQGSRIVKVAADGSEIVIRP